MENNLLPPQIISVWAPIKQLALTVLLEELPLYEKMSSNDDYFDRPQSAIMVIYIISYMSSNNIFFSS